MKRARELSRLQKRLFLALVSFFTYLLVYGLQWVLSLSVGAGQAYLWWLFLAPFSFVLYAFLIGAVSFWQTRRIGLELLDQTLAVLAYILVAFLLDLCCGRLVLTDLVLADLLPDLLQLVTCPILVLCGARVARFFLASKERKSQTK